MYVHYTNIHAQHSLLCLIEHMHCWHIFLFFFFYFCFFFLQFLKIAFVVAGSFTYVFTFFSFLLQYAMQIGLVGVRALCMWSHCFSYCYFAQHLYLKRVLIKVFQRQQCSFACSLLNRGLHRWPIFLDDSRLLFFYADADSWPDFQINFIMNDHI